MSVILQHKRGSSAQWDAFDASGTILQNGEIGYNTDDNAVKIGDGINLWADLEYITAIANKVKHLVKNDSGVTLTKGTVVYTKGANGTNILVDKAIATSDQFSSQVLGFLETTLAPNETGYCVNNGLVTNINTNGLTAGDPVWLSGTVAGGFVTGVSNKPTAPYHLVYLGVITRANTNTGEIFVHISNGWELDELHSVSLTSETNNDVLTYESSTSLWKNKQFSTTSSAVSITDATDSSSTTTGSLKISGGIGIAKNAYIGGDVVITGNVTVNGTTSTVNSTTLSVTDKNIELGKVTTPTNTTADGGGITLKGATDKTFNWVNATTSWTSSENIDLASGKVLKIAGTQVLSATEYTGNAATVTNGVYTTGNQSIAGTKTFTGQITSTLANSTSDGGGQIYLNGSTGNRIDFSTAGLALPSFTTRSVGTKITLYPAVSGSTVDAAFGIKSGPAELWTSIPDSGWAATWYAGTTKIATLSGTGALTVTSLGAGSGTISTTGTVSAGAITTGTLQVTTVPYAYGNRTTTYAVGATAASPPWENVVTQGGITYNSSTKQFTMPRAGLLLITSAFCLPLSSGANNTSNTIRKNGTATLVTSQTMGTNSNSGSSFTWLATGVMQVAANDLIDVYWRCQAGASTTTLDGQNYVTMAYIG